MQSAPVVQSDIRILHKLLAIKLTVSLWSARRKMSAEDMGEVSLPPEDRASLGSKRIADPESIKTYAPSLNHSTITGLSVTA